MDCGDFILSNDYSSNFRHKVPSSPPSRGTHGGLCLKTHDFLRPLEEEEEKGAALQVAADDTGIEIRPAEHALSGGIGTHSMSHVGAGEPAGRRTTRGLGGPAAGGKREPDYWDPEKDHAAAVWPAGQWRHRPFAARGSSAATSAAATGHHAEPEKKLLMEAAASRSNRRFDEEEDDDGLFGQRDDSTSRKESTVRVDGKRSCSDRRPNTPRSKHSATEQRRRTKINDRFQILRELIPHNDQKRDKASFLLEVIEYIQFLQEKIHKYESAYPEWNQENAKSLPWVKVYFRSFWKKARNSNQCPGDGSVSPAYMFSGKFDETGISFAQNPTEPAASCGVSYKTIETSKGFANNTSSQAQSQRSTLPVPANRAASNHLLNEHGEAIIDEGTVSASAAYSQGLLHTLTQALQNSGVDVSQSNISVEINLGKRANNRTAAIPTASGAEVGEGPLSTNQAIGHSRMRSSSEGRPSQLPKRPRMDK